MTIRAYEPGDEHALLEAFNATGRDLNPDFRPRDLAVGRWRFEDNPAGWRVVLALGAEGEVLAQYAGLPQRGLVDGEEVHWTQAVDSFSVRRTRGLGRRGTFVETGELFAELYGADTGGPDRWMWGYPVPSARRVGQAFLGYQLLRSETWLELDRSRPIDDGEVATPWSWDALDGLAPDLERLWRARAAEGAIVAARGQRELAWRYGAHPRERYELAVTFDGGRLDGFLVFRRARHQEREVGLLVDGLFDRRSAPPLLRWAAERARAEELPVLLTRLSPWCREFELLQELGFRVRPSRRVLVGRGYDRASPPELWARRWYGTPGDSDLW